MKRFPDWDCPQCGEIKIFGSRDKCHHCGCFRSKAFGAPPPPTAVGPKPGDWTCGACTYANFAKNVACKRCARPRPAVAADDDDSTTCVVCMAAPRDTVLVPCKHVCLCHACAQQLHECPVCKTPIAQTERIYLS